MNSDDKSVTFSAARARREFSEILNLVSYTKTIVEIERYGEVVARVVPAIKPAESNRDWVTLVDKYAGVWAGPDYKWADKISRISRKYRNRNFWR